MFVLYMYVAEQVTHSSKPKELMSNRRSFIGRTCAYGVEFSSYMYTYASARKIKEITTTTKMKVS